MKSARILGLIAGLAATTACTGELTQLPLVGEGWALLSAGDKGLYEVANPEIYYPNPKNVAQMSLRIVDGGEICATSGSNQWCGGPLQGIPYRTMLSPNETGYCVRVIDIYGKQKRESCVEGPLPGEYSELPGDKPATVVGSEDKLDDVLTGIKLVVDAINANLEKVGVANRLAVPSRDQLAGYAKGDIALSGGSCADVADYLDSEFSDDHPGTDDYYLDPRAIKRCLEQGECRIDQVSTRSMHEACSSLGGVSFALEEDVEKGIVGAGGYAVETLCTDEEDAPEEPSEPGTEPGAAQPGPDKSNVQTTGPMIKECVGSPLVLDLAGDGLQLKGLDGGATFALLGARPTRVGWLAGSDDALLALDRDGDGVISSGRELFGGATASHGFAALARYDTNRDGKISAADPIFSKLLVWRDNGDGRSEPAELLPLAATGVQSISLAYVRSDKVDSFGNQLGLHGSAEVSHGTIQVIDVWFRLGR